jgi:hypothetical protein
MTGHIRHSANDVDRDGSRPSTFCACRARPSKLRRMSAAPAASQTRSRTAVRIASTASAGERRDSMKAEPNLSRGVW